ncbi:hypothetical protein [Mycolicibacterium wolinskyi]|uniref:hypothetical protein n=1 Tax=Mycolicibacterium wolinskyi TaxID=59750 RepID=UPI0039176C3D
MNAWINLAAVGKILLFGLLVGAAVPAVFAAGVRLNAIGAGSSSGSPRNRVLIGVSWVLVALVLAVVVVGVLFIARDFIGHHTGWHILGAKSH